MTQQFEELPNFIFVTTDVLHSRVSDAAMKMGLSAIDFINRAIAKAVEEAENRNKTPASMGAHLEDAP